MIPLQYIQWPPKEKAHLWYPDWTRPRDNKAFGGRGNRHAQDAWRNSTGMRMPFKVGGGPTWMVCHIYDWAVLCPYHHSNSAGLVLIHPDYSRLTDTDIEVMAWLQKQADTRFDYDPTGIFRGRPATTDCGHQFCTAKTPHYEN